MKREGKKDRTNSPNHVGNEVARHKAEIENIAGMVVHTGSIIVTERGSER